MSECCVQVNSLNKGVFEYPLLMGELLQTLLHQDCLDPVHNVYLFWIIACLKKAHQKKEQWCF